MDEKRLSAETQKKIKALCGRVAVGRGVDEDVRKELIAHMEDKVASYLEGKEKLSEADALLLVERHFGNMKEVESNLRGVHLGAAIDTVGRRLLAVFALSCLVVMGQHLIGVFVMDRVDWVSPHHRVIYDSLPPGEWVTVLIGVVLPAVSGVVIWGVLSGWKSRMERGERPWFASWPLWGVAAVATGALIAEELGWVVPHWIDMAAITSSRHAGIYGMVQHGLVFLIAMGWVWWCGERSMRWSWSAAGGALGWVMWLGISAMLEPGWLWRPWTWGYIQHDWLRDIAGATKHAERIMEQMAGMAVAALLLWVLVVVVGKRERAEWGKQ